MKKFLLSTAVALTTCFVCGLGLTSCSEDASDSPSSVSTRTTENLAQIISTNKTLYANVTYVLTGKTYVKDGATLTIEPGTRIEGVSAALPVNASALIITKGSKIVADGRADAPIIMTAQNGTKGGWGGLVILGQAIVNQGTSGTIEGINGSVVPSGVDITYGGTNDADSSGVLRYVRVEYAGAAIADANELNSFTFGGVGSKTVVDHCQAYQGADDAFEFFGGAVNCKYLVATACDDDAFDFDFGYRGKIQFAVATIDPSLTYSSDPNGIECDNDGSSSALTPFTHPVLSNLTIVGTSTGKTNANVALKSAADFRRNCQFTLVNSVLYGFPRGILKETVNTTYTLENNVVCAVPSTGINFSADKSATTTFTPSTTNSGLTSYYDIILTSPFGDYYNSNDLRPTGGAAIDGSYYQHTDSFFAQTTYKGAIDKSTRVNSWLQENWIR